MVEIEGEEWTVLSDGGVRINSPGYQQRMEMPSGAVHVEDWRRLLSVNANVEFKYNEKWLHAHVHSVNPLVVQPLFTRTLLPLSPHCIRRTSTVIDMRWELAHPLRHYLLGEGGTVHVIEKNVGEFFLTKNNVYVHQDDVTDIVKDVLPERKHVCTLARRHGTQFSDQYSIRQSLSYSDWQDVKRCLNMARCYKWFQSPLNLNGWVSDAVEVEDMVYANELIGASHLIHRYRMAQWFEWMYYAVPYLSFEFHPSKVDVYWTGAMLLPELVRSAVSPFLLPHCVRIPKAAPLALPPYTKAPVALLPQQKDLLTKMERLEERHVSKLLCRQVSGLLFSEYVGFVDSVEEVAGGVLCSPHGHGKTWMALELCRRRPMRTLIVVPSPLLYHWLEAAQLFGLSVSLFHGSDRCTGDLTLTTTHTINRHAVGLFDRIMLDEGHLVKQGSTTMRTLCAMPATCLWYISATPEKSSYCTFLRMYPYAPGSRDYRTHATFASIRVRGSLKLCAPEKVSVKCELPNCYGLLGGRLLAKGGSRVLLDVLRYDPSLLPPQHLYERVLVSQSTLPEIAKKYSVKQSILEDQHDCAVCLSPFTRPTVTNCGHIFCYDCSEQLQLHSSDCPLCRTKITDNTEISSSPVDVLTIKGKHYVPSTLDLRRGNLLELLRGMLSACVVYCTRSAEMARHLGKELNIGVVSCKTGIVQRGKCLTCLREGGSLVITLSATVGLSLNCVDTLVLVDKFVPVERIRLIGRLQQIGQTGSKIVDFV